MYVHDNHINSYIEINLHNKLFSGFSDSGPKDELANRIFFGPCLRK